MTRMVKPPHRPPGEWHVVTHPKFPRLVCRSTFQESEATMAKEETSVGSRLRLSFKSKPHRPICYLGPFHPVPCNMVFTLPQTFGAKNGQPQQMPGDVLCLAEQPGQIISKEEEEQEASTWMKNDSMITHHSKKSRHEFS